MKNGAQEICITFTTEEWNTKLMTEDKNKIVLTLLLDNHAHQLRSGLCACRTHHYMNIDQIT